jgi:hypothetical protein
MGLSRWGARADAKLNEPLPEKTFSETITDVILHAEREDTIRLLFNGLAWRLVPHFPLETMEIVYDSACQWYVVKCRRKIQEGPTMRDAVVVVNIRDEDIAMNATEKVRWNHFLDTTCNRMLRELRMQSPDNLTPLIVDVQAQTEYFNDAVSRLAVEVNEFGIAFARVGELEEQEAIDSIMRSIEAQGQ